MKTLAFLAALLLPTIACGQPCDLEAAYGLCVYFVDGEPTNVNQINQALEEVMVWVDAHFGAKKVDAVLHMLDYATLYVQDALISCGGVSRTGLCSGVYYPNNNSITLQWADYTHCVANTALVHELGHLVLAAISGDADVLHLDDRFFPETCPDAACRLRTMEMSLNVKLSQALCTP